MELVEIMNHSEIWTDFFSALLWVFWVFFFSCPSFVRWSQKSSGLDFQTCRRHLQCTLGAIPWTCSSPHPEAPQLNLKWSFKVHHILKWCLSNVFAAGATGQRQSRCGLNWNLKTRSTVLGGFFIFFGFDTLMFDVLHLCTFFKTSPEEFKVKDEHKGRC